MSLPQEAEKLLVAPPDRFVAERNALAKQLRGEGRSDDADAVAALKKPSVVVYAVNRAARDRPKPARAAAAAAVDLRNAQAGGDAEAFDSALAELDEALDLLADVALAHLSTVGTKPSDAMRRRLRDLLRRAAADEDARKELARGALTTELEASGFSSFAGVSPKPRARADRTSAADRKREKERERREQLEAELAEAETRLRDATAAARDAERERARAEKAVESLRARLR